MAKHEKKDYSEFFGELADMVDIFSTAEERVIKEPTWTVSITVDDSTITMNMNDYLDMKELVDIMVNYGALVAVWKNEDEE